MTDTRPCLLRTTAVVGAARAAARSVRRVGSVVGLVLVTTCGVAHGQAEESRAAEIERARRAKGEALAEAPPPNKVERAFTFIEQARLFQRIFNPPRGWFAQVGGVGEGNGFTLGGGYRQPTALGALTLRGLGSLRESYLVSADFSRAFLPRDAGEVGLTVMRRHEAAQRFYGAGPDSEFDDRSSFGLSATQVEGHASVRVTRWLTGTATVGYAVPDLGASSEASRVPGTQEAFTEAEAPGLTFQPAYVTATLGALIDTRDTGNPRQGGLYLLQLRRFDDQDGGAFSFTDTRIDLQQFIPFWNLSRVLALRVLAQHADGLGQAQVPFYLMPTLGGARGLRGYERQRFRDRSLILVSAEYRYEINPFLMAAVFYDAGQVAPDWSNFRLRDFRDNYGVGFRFGYSNAVALRADLAFGGESTARLIVGFSTSF
ncbi:hypothetical protein TBR22_A28900 [Luteitalea sp. TBR-22]|uniref:BamA/TamA family outer membrane protein n=1 Tax=Luteitalea sp. TBR-22 TaxID=2802971 RepID=UPI001AFCAF01|nr:BamA/TamA family outer membrane protein [Luteitalea sp. TBR-22]BCS33663.1 hypothetical protein TBR22_A28900 [Luteitalea sp. TBR-22]